ncbi:hypothetical protein Pmani_020791 [Petrolisthes manimaculis]|uniref:UBX domain-containing protein 11 n=1 Tax=Petrolisthes manimaculis TaxID=1843537 RepID=A0AAE1U3X5_9EUCA|nr:hypothetical protein Pmani_020791 [Petrolisthes manimaculis]
MGQVNKAQSHSEKEGHEEGKRNLPFRHPDFSDDQIRQLTDITSRTYKSSSSVASRRSTSRPHSGCSSPILSPSIQRLRTEGFPPLARCGSDPLLHGAPPPQNAMNTGSLPCEMLPHIAPVVSPTPTAPPHHQHHHHHHHRQQQQQQQLRRTVTNTSRDVSPRDISLGVGLGLYGRESTSSGGGSGGAAIVGAGGAGAGGDRELLGLLMNRLVTMETQLSHTRQALRQRDFHIAVLEEKLRLYMKAEEDAVGSKTGFLDKLKDSRMASVEEKCLKLERQVMEMERFLSEYGMVWCEAEETYLLDNPVNPSCSYSSSEATTPNLTPSHTPRSHPRVRIKRHKRTPHHTSFLQPYPTHSKDTSPHLFPPTLPNSLQGHLTTPSLLHSPTTRNHKNREVRRVVAESTSRSISSEAEPFSLDYEKLLAAITELNIMAQGDATAEVGDEVGESLQLTLYKNGIVVDEGAFRSFEVLQTRQFLQDILDGFFPSELQDIYPEGVPIKVRDKRQVIFLPKSRPRAISRPPVPPKPSLTATTDSFTSVTSTVFSSVSESDQRPIETATIPQENTNTTDVILPTTAAVPETTGGGSSHLCPEVEYRSESSDMGSSRRNSLQRGSDKSEGEGAAGKAEGRRGSELWRPVEAPVISNVRRESRRGSDARRGSDHRTHQCRRGSECRRTSELARSTLDLELGRRATSKHPLEWNRINRTAFLLNDDTFDSNGNHMRRGSLGVITADPYDMDSLRKRRTSVEDFLARVPTCVVKNGKIVNLREEVADMLMGPSRKNSLTLVHTPVLDEAGESQESNEQDNNHNNHNNDQHLLNNHLQLSTDYTSSTTTTATTDTNTTTTTATTTTSSVHHHHHHEHGHTHGPTRTSLRIKVENGTETYLIKLKASDTLNTLRSYLRSYRGDHEEFEIVRTYPYQVLSQGDASMADLGLTPNAALHLKVASRRQPPETLPLCVSSGVGVGVGNSGALCLNLSSTNTIAAAISTISSTIAAHHTPTAPRPHSIAPISIPPLLPTTSSPQHVPAASPQQHPPTSPLPHTPTSPHPPPYSPIHHRPQTSPLLPPTSPLLPPVSPHHTTPSSSSSAPPSKGSGAPSPSVSPTRSSSPRRPDLISPCTSPRPPRRTPSPALPQIPPHLHPDLPPPSVPLLCFPDSAPRRPKSPARDS